MCGIKSFLNKRFPVVLTKTGFEKKVPQNFARPRGKPTYFGRGVAHPEIYEPLSPQETSLHEIYGGGVALKVYGGGGVESRVAVIVSSFFSGRDHLAPRLAGVPISGAVEL
jgi:hypothetical protein